MVAVAARLGEHAGRSRFPASSHPLHAHVTLCPAHREAGHGSRWRSAIWLVAEPVECEARLADFRWCLEPSNLAPCTEAKQEPPSVFFGSALPISDRDGPALSAVLAPGPSTANASSRDRGRTCHGNGARNPPSAEKTGSASSTASQRFSLLPLSLPRPPRVRPRALSPSVVATVPWNGCGTPWRSATSSTSPIACPTAAESRPPGRRSARGRTAPRVGLAADLRIQRRIDREDEITLDRAELVDVAVVHEQPPVVVKRVAVGPLHGAADRCADVGEKQRRTDVACELVQVVVVSRRFDASVDPRGLGSAVPPGTEPVAVRRLGPEPRVQTLVHRRVRSGKARRSPGSGSLSMRASGTYAAPLSGNRIRPCCSPGIPARQRGSRKRSARLTTSSLRRGLEATKARWRVAQFVAARRCT